MIEPLRLTVLTPTGVLLEAKNVSRVQVQLADGGGIGIYPGHAPLLAETVAAPLTYSDAVGEHTLELEAGILHVDQHGVMVLSGGLLQPAADVAERGAPMSFQRLSEGLLAALQGNGNGQEER